MLVKPEQLTKGARLRFTVAITGNTGTGKVLEIREYSPYPYRIEWVRDSDKSRMIQQFNMDCFSTCVILGDTDAQTQS